MYVLAQYERGWFGLNPKLYIYHSARSKIRKYKKKKMITYIALIYGRLNEKCKFGKIPGMNFCSS